MKNNPNTSASVDNGQEKSITSVMHEHRTFTPPEGFSEEARVKSLRAYKQLYRQAESDPEKFWGDITGQLHWFKPWKKLLQWHSWTIVNEKELTSWIVDRLE